jgi:hypothetical protein
MFPHLLIPHRTDNDIQAKETAKALSAKKSLLRARQSLAEANDYEGERDEGRDPISLDLPFEFLNILEP